MTLHIFINPKSGGGKGNQLANRLSAHHVIIIDPVLIIKQIEKHVNPNDRIIIAGGDGTVSLVVNGLLKAGLSETVKVAVYPLGTGNDIFRSLSAYHQRSASLRHRSASLHQLAAKLEEQQQNTKVADMPVWRYGKVTMIAYLGMGIDAEILNWVDLSRKRFPSHEVLTRFFYFLAGIIKCNYKIKEPVFIELNESRKIDLRGHAGVILSNMNSYAGGSKISADDMSKPSLNVTILRNYSDLIRIAMNRFSGFSFTPTYSGIERISIQGSPIPTQIDGEMIDFRSTSIKLSGTISFIGEQQ